MHYFIMHTLYFILFSGITLYLKILKDKNTQPSQLTINSPVKKSAKVNDRQPRQTLQHQYKLLKLTFLLTVRDSMVQN